MVKLYEFLDRTLTDTTVSSLNWSAKLRIEPDVAEVRKVKETGDALSKWTHLSLSTLKSESRIMS